MGPCVGDVDLYKNAAENSDLFTCRQAVILAINQNIGELLN